MTNPIAVSQRAREAALGLHDSLMRAISGSPDSAKERMAYISGENDETYWTQAFARFEAEIRADERERAVKVADQRVQLLHDLDGPMAQMRAREASLIATAIRNQRDHDHE
ncbi:hypothetical protein IL54_4691 [Sphingobium sp. ba1]|uniref:hypothetical protein n=1 Tax=Sphingobium sp. ba1 TaxID=1522072 RepID=UPI0005608ACA|nr:hypothetical protein [Sphingobium sp. ba1]OMG61353.1 hypothetical protein IL54_4691 [Sphingobium sp. ba1]